MTTLRFAGQITGVEGYVESAAMGLICGRHAAAEKLGEPIWPYIKSWFELTLTY